jgi:hypothetical protein
MPYAKEGPMDLLALPFSLWIAGMMLTPCLVAGAGVTRRSTLILPAEIIGVGTIIAGVAMLRLRGEAPISALVMAVAVACVPTILARRFYVPPNPSTKQRR